MARRYVLEQIKKRRELKLPAKASLWYVGSGIFVKLLGVLSTPIFTRVLSEEEYGQFTFYMSFVAVLFGVVSVLFSPAVIYKGIQNFRENSDEYISKVLYVDFGVLTLICTLLFAFNDYLGLNQALVLFIFLQLACDVVVLIYESKKRYAYEYMAVVKINTLKAISAPLLSLFLLFWAELGYYSRIFGILAVSLFIALPLLSNIMKRGGRFSDKKIFGYIIRQSLPLLPLALTGAVSGGIDKIIMNKLLGAAVLAKYSVAYTIGIGLSFLTGSLSSALTPWVMRKLSGKDTDVVRGIGYVIFRGVCGAALFVIALAPEALEFLAPNRYSEAIFAVMPIAISILPSFLYTYSNIGLIYKEKAGVTSIGALLALLVNIALNIILIPRITYLGGGVSLLISSSVMAAVNLFFLSRYRLSSMIDTRKCGGVFIFTALFGIFITLIYEYAALKFLLLIIPAVMILNSFFEAKKYVTE